MRGLFLNLIIVVFFVSLARADPTQNLFTAIETVDHIGIKTALSQKANVKARNEQGETVLHLCARVGDAVPMAELIEQGAAIDARNALGQTPLHVACAYGHGEEVRTLIALGADLLLADREGLTAIELAVQNEEWEILEFLHPLVEEARARPPVLRGFRIPTLAIPVGIVLMAGIGYFGSRGE